MHRIALTVISICIVMSDGFAKTNYGAEDAKACLESLDKALSKRQLYINQRQHRIDSLCNMLPRSSRRVDLMENIITEYTSFNNDSALHYIDEALRIADSNEAVSLKLKRATLLPLAGFFETAVKEFMAIDTISLPAEDLSMYYDSGRQMYSYICDFYKSYPSIVDKYKERELDLLKKLINVLPKGSAEYNFYLGEYYYETDELSKAKAVLTNLIEHQNPSHNLAARARHHLSSIAEADGDQNGYVYYLAGSAIEDVISATREVVSLQELGSKLYELGDPDRSYNYINAALANAVECGAAVRMVESSKGMPIIQRTHIDRVRVWRHTTYIIIIILAFVMIGLFVSLKLLRRDMKRMSDFQLKLKQANHIKEIYISQFLSLCSIYMDKLNQFCKIANRKISTGKVDDLYRLTKSGKFVEEQSREFYDVFDNAFLHIYPTFVADVNKLLRMDSQIVLKSGERMNTDLRILAFIRLGIEDSNRIAQVLNYSLNTIYSYRNRMKMRAINHDGFENEIMKIGSID
jgi:DNA-binding CsgD family transcriptional regulator